MLSAKEWISQIVYRLNQGQAISKSTLHKLLRRGNLCVLNYIKNFRFGDWELPGEGEKETPIQKYQRLQCEIKDLYEEVNDLKVSKHSLKSLGFPLE